MSTIASADVGVGVACGVGLGYCCLLLVWIAAMVQIPFRVFWKIVVKAHFLGATLTFLWLIPLSYLLGIDEVLNLGSSVLGMISLCYPFFGFSVVMGLWLFEGYRRRMKQNSRN